MRSILLCFLLSVFFLNANADYLIVNRVANLRSQPNTQSEILEKLVVGDTLTLVEPTLADSYYHVTSISSGQTGWVYSGLVRKYSGNLESISTNTKSLASGGVVDVRVLDVGQGLCTIIKLPGNKYVIYDAGGDLRAQGSRTLQQITDLIGTNVEIELMVLSHTDYDHISAAAGILNTYKVKRVIWGGYNPQQTATYSRLVATLSAHQNTENINLSETGRTISPGYALTIGNTNLTFLCGFGKPMSDWSLDDAEKRNAVSIVMKLTYGSNSILFCGDAVGRHKDDPNENALIATEKFMVENASSLLPSTVLIAPHHGASNGSSTAFVNLVHPKVVIFSSGRGYRHPTTRTATKYLQYTNQIYRTDRGDDEGGEEWSAGRISGNKDSYKDDDIQIQLRANNTFRVVYVNP